MAIFITRESKRFVDVSLAFEANPISGDLTLLQNERAINNSLRNLMMIAVSEVPFKANVGSGVGSYLFEEIDEITADLLTHEIERVIKFSEPRVELVIPDDFTDKESNDYLSDIRGSVQVDAKPDQNAFMVTITYKIVGYEQIFTVNQLLEPTR